MDPRVFYRLTEPTEWAGPPEKYSYSSMKQMSVCLLQWQLGRSKYNELKRYPERPSEAAYVGVLVHEILNKLFRAMAIAGYPEIGTEDFLAAVKGVDILGKAKSGLEKFAQEAHSNPRAIGFRLQSTPRDVYNKVVQAFRLEYAAIAQHAPALETRAMQTTEKSTGTRSDLLRIHGFLSEEKVTHPSLPLLGFIDLLVRRDNQTTILDFKTGAPQPQYRDQLRLYALMWWRSTGDAPTSLELRYGAKVERWPVTPEELVDVETSLEEKIREYHEGLQRRPAVPTPGDHCNRCGVRQMCNAYWMAKTNAVPNKDEWVDIEVVVRAVGARGGFVGTNAAGEEITIVHEDEVTAKVEPFQVGERLRILNALLDADGEAVQITRGTEVFRVGHRPRPLRDEAPGNICLG